MLYKLITSDKQSRQRKRPIGHVSRDGVLSNQNEEFIFFKKFNFIKCKNAIDLKFTFILSFSHSYTQSAMQTDNEIEPDFTNIVKVSQIENRFAL